MFARPPAQGKNKRAGAAEGWAACCIKNAGADPRAYTAQITPRIHALCPSGSCAVSMAPAIAEHFERYAAAACF